MPIFEFICECGCEFDDFFLNSERDVKKHKCPQCGEMANKVISKCSIDVRYSNPQELYEKKIKPDVKETVDKVKKGNDNAMDDIIGKTN